MGKFFPQFFCVLEKKLLCNFLQFWITNDSLCLTNNNGFLAAQQEEGPRHALQMFHIKVEKLTFMLYHKLFFYLWLDVWFIILDHFVPSVTPIVEWYRQPGPGSGQNCFLLKNMEISSGLPYWPLPDVGCRGWLAETEEILNVVFPYISSIIQALSILKIPDNIVLKVANFPPKVSNYRDIWQSPPRSRSFNGRRKRLSIEVSNVLKAASVLNFVIRNSNESVRKWRYHNTRTWT